MTLSERPLIQRYIVIGSLNFIVFFILYQILFLLLGDEGHLPTIAWAVAWIIGSIFAHHTHRNWTFESGRGVQWTFSATMSVYVSGWIGSTATFDWMLFHTVWDHNLIWLLNTGIWGVIDYLGLRYVAFREINDD